jgi:hypothetical protein
MTTPWYARFLELIGFDILVIGALFILAVMIARELLKSDPPFAAFNRAWDDFRNLFGLNNSAGEQGTSLLQTAKAIGGGAAILILAAVAGIVLDGVAHRVVDYDAEKGPTFGEMIKFAMPDDVIKREAFEAAAAPWTDSWDRGDKDNAKRGPSERWATRQAKELYQDAYLRVLDSGKQDIKTALARDELLLKLFRVMLVLTSLLALFALGTAWKPHRAQRFALLLLFAFASVLFLYLWSTQSRHYYKRVFHAYALIDGKTPPTGFLPKSPDSKTMDCAKSGGEPDKNTNLETK